MSERLFACAECGGDVRMQDASGREVLGMTVPEGMRLATCDKCGESYFGGDDIERIDIANKATP